MRKLYRELSNLTHDIELVFGAARSFQWSQDQLLASLAKIRDELSSKTPKGRWRYSEFERHYANGYIAARHHDIWQYLEFCYRDADGTLFSVDKNSTHRKTEEFYAADRGAELGKLECTHVWKGTDRNYGPWVRRE